MSEIASPTGATTPYSVDVALRWGDQDSLGHVNNVQIARIFEEARVRTMNAWFVNDRPGYAGVLVRQEIEFASILHYSTEPVRVELWIPRIGTSSFDFGCRLIAPDGTLACLCETTLTGIDLVTGTTIPIPDSVRSTLQAHPGAPVPLRRRG